MAGEAEGLGVEALAEAIQKIVRGEQTSLDSCLATDVTVAQVVDTATTSRVHVIKKDGNGRIRVSALAENLATRIVDFCIPRRRILEAQKYLDEYNDTRQFVRLTKEAAGLFTTLKKSGEGGELLLYTLLESFLEVPQVLCKMPLKTSENMHVHGADGVHAKGLEDGKLAIYWGESKLYGSVAGAIRDCMDSLAPLLVDEEWHRDLMLVRDNLDTGDQLLTARLLEYFDQDSAKSADLVVRGACLIGFSQGDDEYPDCPEEVADEVGEELSALVAGWNDKLRSRVTKRGLADFEIEVFLLPFPSVESFREMMLEELGIAD